MNNKALNILKLVLSTAFYLALPYFYYTCFRYHFVASEEYQMFTTDFAHLKEALSYPGGLMGYIGEFLTACFHFLAGGPLITGISVAICGILLEVLFSKVQKKHCFFVVPLLIALQMAIMHLNILVNISSTVMFAFTLGLALVYISFKKDTIRWAVGLSMLILSYWLASSSSIILFSLFLVWELFQSKSPKRFIFLGISAFVVVAFPLVARILLENSHPMTLKLAYWSDVFVYDKVFEPSQLFVVWFSPAIGMCFLFLYYRILAKRMPVLLRKSTVYILVMIQLAAFGFLLKNALDRYETYKNDEIFMKADYMVKNEEWEEIIRMTRNELTLSPMNYPYINLALAKTGKMSTLLMDYPDNSPEMMLIPFMQDYLSAKILNQIFYQVGDITNALHMAFEGRVSTPGAHNIILMKSEIECRLILGDYVLAKKELARLARTPFYGKWARNILRLLTTDPKAIDTLPWVASKRQLLAKNNTIMNFDNIVQVCVPLLDANPNNKVAFEYITASFLLESKLQLFANIYGKYYPNATAEQVPALHQQVIAAYLDATKAPAQIWDMSPISMETKRAFVEFRNTFIKYKQENRSLDSDFARKFQGTYWLYYLNNAKK